MARIQWFTKDQIKRLSNIFDNAGQVILATVILPVLLIDDVNASLVIVGVLFTIVLWWMSLRLERKSS